MFPRPLPAPRHFRARLRHSAQTVARRPRVRQGRRQVSEMKVGKDTPCALNGGVRNARRQRFDVQGLAAD